MDHKVILSDLFLSDLQDIIEHLIQAADAKTASRIGHELLDRTAQIGRQPLSGSPVLKRPGVRKVFIYSYILYYEVRTPLQTVEMLRIWHGARNPKTLRFN